MHITLAPNVHDKDAKMSSTGLGLLLERLLWGLLSGSLRGLYVGSIIEVSFGGMHRTRLWQDKVYTFIFNILLIVSLYYLMLTEHNSADVIW